MKSKLRLRKRAPWSLLLFPVVWILSIPLPARAQGSLPDTDALPFSLSAVPVAGLRLNEVKGRALRHFIRHFPQVATEKWVLDNQHFVASFVDGCIPERAYYDNKGYFECCIKSYGPADLDPVVGETIRQRFPGSFIKVVNEVGDKTMRSRAYYVILRDSDLIRSLVIVNGNIEEENEFTDIGR